MYLRQTPEIVKISEIPGHLRSFESASREIVKLLPRLGKGQALALRFMDESELKASRKQILTAGIRHFGRSGEVKTGSIDNILYVWMRSKEITPEDELKTSFSRLIGEA